MLGSIIRHNTAHHATQLLQSCVHFYDIRIDRQSGPRLSNGFQNCTEKKTFLELDSLVHCHLTIYYD